ncbi:hypothetical protein CspHIS471_0204590 [Cutaneotrichosporon sp. HIS471]|nr:hypothetical protein CspHIS471_0204590 [Cutaneotrichosporon sp. HIS471]
MRRFYRSAEKVEGVTDYCLQRRWISRLFCRKPKTAKGPKTFMVKRRYWDSDGCLLWCGTNRGHEDDQPVPARNRRRDRRRHRRQQLAQQNNADGTHGGGCGCSNGDCWQVVAQFFLVLIPILAV